jgi:hypothetical protein
LKKWLLSSRANEVLEDLVIKDRLLGIKDKYETREFRFIRENYPAGHQGVKKLRDLLNTDLGLS